MQWAHLARCWQRMESVAGIYRAGGAARSARNNSTKCNPITDHQACMYTQGILCSAACRCAHGPVQLQRTAYLPITNHLTSPTYP